MSDNQEIGKRLAEAREGLNISRSDAAKAFNVPYQTYAAHENGNRGIPRDALEKYARKFGVSVDWLLTGKGKPPKSRHRPDLALPGWQLSLKYALQDAVSSGIDRASVALFLADEVTRLLAADAAAKGADVQDIVRSVVAPETAGAESQSQRTAQK